MKRSVLIVVAFPFLAFFVSSLIRGGEERLYAPNDCELFIFDTETDSLVGSVEMGPCPAYRATDVELLESGEKLYVSHRDIGLVTVRDPFTGEHLKDIGIPGPPGFLFYIAEDPSSCRLYVADILTNSIHVLDTIRDEYVTTISDVDRHGSSPSFLSLRPGGSFLYAGLDAGSADALAVIDTSTLSVVDYVTTGHDAPSGASVMPDGSKLYLSNRDSSRVSVLDGATLEELTSIGCGFNPAVSAMLPDGSKVYVPDTYGQLSVVDTSTDTVSTTIEGHHNPHQAVASALYPRVYVRNQDGHYITIIDTNDDVLVDYLITGRAFMGMDIGVPSRAVYWARTYGGGSEDRARRVCVTEDGGFVAAGWTSSFGVGGVDAWILRLDVSGDIEWEKTCGGVSDEHPSAIAPTVDGGLVMTVSTLSFGSGHVDTALVKLDSQGDMEWQKVLGGVEADRPMALRQTSDGGFIVASHSFSFGPGLYDPWIMKFGSSGDAAWQKTFGKSSTDDFANDIAETTDGGYVIGGGIRNTGGYDLWVVRIGAEGATEWEKSYGGGGEEQAYAVRQTDDGGFIVAGYTLSFGAGGVDGWVLKLDSAGSVEWEKAFGGPSEDLFYSLDKTGDGGFILAGPTDSLGAGGKDVLLLKLDARGDVEWRKTYGGEGEEQAYSVRRSGDGGFIAGGFSASFGAGDDDAWVLKVDAEGNIDASCDMINIPSVQVTDTSATVSSTGVTANEILEQPADISMTVGDSAALIETQCETTAFEEPCLFRAVSSTLQTASLFISPREGNDIAFAPPFDAPYHCPVFSGALEPEPVLGDSGTAPLIFYQIDDHDIRRLRVVKDRPRSTLLFSY